VDEHVLAAAIGLDEAIALEAGEPLHHAVHIFGVFEIGGRLITAAAAIPAAATAAISAAATAISAATTAAITAAAVAAAIAAIPVTAAAATAIAAAIAVGWAGTRRGRAGGGVIDFEHAQDLTALGALADLDRDRGTFADRIVTGLLECGEVEEGFRRTVAGRHEAESLGGVEPLDRGPHRPVTRRHVHRPQS
jgi:hypothetical protein